MSRLTKQGVRDLNLIGPKPNRGHVGKSTEQVQRSCSHQWGLYSEGRCECECWIFGARCTCATKICLVCGKLS